MDGQAPTSHKGYVFGELSNNVIGAALAVHKELGHGFAEIAYQRALAIELGRRGISFAREVEIPIFYLEEQIDTRRADFVVGELIVELKAVEELVAEHVSQLAMYLKAAGRHAGLLLNFGAFSLEIKRVVK